MLVKFVDILSVREVLYLYIYARQSIANEWELWTHGTLVATAPRISFETLTGIDMRQNNTLANCVPD